MLSRNDIAQGDYEGAAGALLNGVWSFGVPHATPTGVLLQDLQEDPTLGGGEQALVWFARQIYNGDIQRHLANLDQDNRRLLIEVLAGFAGVEL